jgi:A/G-specific adenine glycosylase
MGPEDLAGERTRALRRALVEFGERRQLDFEWSAHRTPYRVLVAEVLLARTGADRVAEVFPEFVRRYPDLESLAAADPAEVRAVVRPLGITGRADRLRAMARKFVSEHGGEVPGDRGELLEVRGLGPYCANAILCFGHGEPAPIVDVNVTRVLGRVLGIPRGERTGPRMRELAARLVPEARAADYNYGLLHLGIRVCTHSRPACAECPLGDICDRERRQRRESVVRFLSE